VGSGVEFMEEQLHVREENEEGRVLAQAQENMVWYRWL
jgi:hypothetical protein